MEVIDVDSEPVPPCQEEEASLLEEVFSIDWKPAELGFEDGKYSIAFVKYLIKNGPRIFPTFKKRLKQFKRLLRRLRDGETFFDSSISTSDKLSNIKSLLAEIGSQVTVATVKSNQPGLHKFFVEGRGKEFLRSFGRKYSCSVETITETPVIVLGGEIDEVPNRKIFPLQGVSHYQEQFTVESAPINATATIHEHEPMEQGNPWGSTWIKNTRIQFCSGDLTKQTTDAILIINQHNLDLNKGGQLNREIVKAGGSSVKKDCKKVIAEKGVQLPGEAVMTGSGNLPCGHIIHVIRHPGSPQILDLQLGVKKGLQLADARGLVSIALPAIGAGAMQLSLGDSSRVLSGSILSFLGQAPRSLREIKIVLLEESTLMSYFHEMKLEFVPFVVLEEYSSLSSTNPSDDDFKLVPLSQPDLEECKADDEQIVNSPPSSPTQFRVYGKNRLSIVNAISTMRLLFAKHRTSQKITHKMVPQITQECWSSLSKVAVHHEVELMFNASENSITVRGNANDVSKVVGRVWREITRMAERRSDSERRKLLTKYVRWNFILLDKEISIKENISASLEDAYNQQCREVRLFVQNSEFKVDFNAMTVFSIRSKNPALRLSRRMATDSGIVMPDCWNPQPCFPDGGPIPVVLVNLEPSEGEYRHIFEMFVSTGGYGTILSIERVQNPCLYTQYATYKQEVERNNGRSGYNNQNERQLFHGTTGCNVKAINLQGFNRNFCGRNGAMYGNGVYFASNASYSMTFATRDSLNVRRMYLARVVVGFFAPGQKGLLVPPPLLHHAPEVLFDSVVDNVTNPKVFVVFRDFQCYPEYLITFKTTA
ncbi:protein mono-ADP-ribosyltransferase PARP14-like [Montipora capricornis]|uniref:protein mono-ADP-ribosyltransferase PARP14-like n=1 Tax=Montipora capricornis TaxID=246305 RepID=UPI0035F1CC26